MAKSRVEAQAIERVKVLVRQGVAPRMATAQVIEEMRASGKLPPAAPRTDAAQQLRAVTEEAEKAMARLSAKPATVDPRPQPAPRQAVPPTPQKGQRPFGSTVMGELFKDKKYDLSKLTGFQRAALRCGVDINKIPAATLEGMSLGQMGTLSQEQQLQNLKEFQEKRAADWAAKFR